MDMGLQGVSGKELIHPTLLQVKHFMESGYANNRGKVPTRARAAPQKKKVAVKKQFATPKKPAAALKKLKEKPIKMPKAVPKQPVKKLTVSKSFPRRKVPKK